MAELDEVRVIEEVERLLAERGSMTVDELVVALREHGVDPGSEEEFVDLLYDEVGPDFTAFGDGRWAYLPRLLRNRILTHRLTEVEVEHNIVHINPDLELILLVEDESLHFSQGEPIRIEFPHRPQEKDERRVPTEVLDPSGSLVLPVGTLADGDVDSLVRLELTDQGLELQPVLDLTGDPAAVVARLREVVDLPNPPHLLTDTVVGICVDLPESFTQPLPPLTDLIAEAGLGWQGDWLAPADFDFDKHFVDTQVDGLVDRHQLDRDEALAVIALLRLQDRMVEAIHAVIALERGDEGPSEQLADFRQSLAEDLAGGMTIISALPFLTEPWIARAFVTEALGYTDHRASALGLTVEALEEHSPRAVRPALRWLRAKAYERRGEIIEAEECLLAAEKLDPDWSPVLVDLARYASDRGDAARGLALLRRAEPEDVDPLLEEVLTVFLPTSGQVVGRNDPCWCGSGRKFKQCHLYRPVAPPIEERAVWLYQKAGRFVQDGPCLPLLYELYSLRTAHIEDDDEAADDVGNDSFILDVALFEGGAFAEFVEHRGVLLPDDERLLADQWLLGERSVFEVSEVRPGEGFTARDLRTGDEHRVRDRAASGQIKPGMMICSRIVPAGDTMQVFGGIEPVSLGERDALMELLDSDPDPQELVAFCSRRFASPTLTNTEGDSIVLCETVLSVTDPDAVRSGLDHAYRREDEEPPGWISVRSIDGADRILASLRIKGADLSISTNSERRLNEVLATIRELDPDATVVRDERQPLPDARAAAKLSRQQPLGAASSGRSEQQSPEGQEALAAYMRDYEQKWLDLSIPALRGLTPREAASDPTRREDLVRLLASFGDEPDNPMTMSPARLRRALGLS